MTPAPVPSAAELKQAATDVWSSPQIKSIQVNPSDVSMLSKKIEGDLLNRGFRPTNGNAQGTFGEVSRMIPDTSVQSVGVDDLRAARRALGMTAKQIDPATMTATPDATAARSAISHVDDFLDNLAPELQEANQNYAAGKSAERLDYRTIKADRRAAKSGSGMNIENTIRQEVDKIPDRGLSPEQKAIRDAIVMGTPMRNGLRTAGKLGVDGGLSLMLHGGAALGTGGTTLPVTVGGTIARKVGEGLTRSAIKRLSENIRGNSPLARSLPPVAAPLPNPVMSGVATPITVADLIAAITGRRPGIVPSYAEEDQRQ
jgi:hypothetical protein